MFPTFNHGDKILQHSLDYGKPIKIEKNDVITFMQDGMKYIKRVVAVPGDEVLIVDGSLWVNKRPNIYYSSLNNYTEGLAFVILGPGEYYVLGDNRENSTDSRIFGPVNIQNILGKVFFKCHNPIKI